MNTLELHLSSPARRLEPLVDGNAGAGRQEIAGALFEWDALELVDEGGGEVDPSGLTALTVDNFEDGTPEVDVLPGFVNPYAEEEV